MKTKENNKFSLFCTCLARQQRNEGNEILIEVEVKRFFIVISLDLPIIDGQTDGEMICRQLIDCVISPGRDVLVILLSDDEPFVLEHERNGH
jgi:hypothetical protein